MGTKFKRKILSALKYLPQFLSLNVSLDSGSNRAYQVVVADPAWILNFDISSIMIYFSLILILKYTLNIYLDYWVLGMYP